jgi:formylglycine-generating enzyme
MRFCSNCGRQIPAEAKFCSFCGHKVEQQEQSGQVNQAWPEAPEIVRDFDNEETPDPTYHLLEKGNVFCGYTIIRMLNKDPEGFKYIAGKDGKEYVLKLFFTSEFSNLHTLINLHTRLKRLNNLDTVHTARVVEVNQNHDPAYMVSEYIKGESLAQIKASDPERLTESFVREIARKLIQTAITVHKHGLTMHKLTPSGIMVEESGEITVLSSGINYEEIDEREEIFNIGVILAQLLSKNVLNKTIYNPQRLQEQKFSYISGTSIAFNKLLADCLHRNILHRINSLESLLKRLNSLPRLGKNEIFWAPETSKKLSDIQNMEPPKPETMIDWKFYGLLSLILLLLVFIFSYALPWMNQSRADKSEASIVMTEPEDTTEAQTTDRQNDREELDAGANRPLQRDERDDPRRLLVPVEPDYEVPETQIRTSIPIPADFVHVPDGSFGFSRLKDNPNHNVSQDGFYISSTEITQADWNKYMMPAEVSFAGDTLPVDNVSWMRIIRYCNARSEDEGLEPAYTITGSSASSVTCNFSANGYRLPTEAEWEMAAKAGNLYAYSGSDDPDDVAWHRDNSGARIHRGGGKNSNAYGIYDMTGNVAEWCWDWYDPEYPNRLGTFINPKGPSSGTLKVIRGGSVRNGEGTNLGILYRDKGNPSRGYQFVGFRIVRIR